MHVNANSAFLEPVQRDKLLNRLEGLPLAIAQAGAFLKESQMKFEDYIDFYDRKFERLVDDGPEEQLLQYHGSIWTTWVISFDEIRSKSDAGMAAANLLILWSCFDNKDLGYELFSGTTLDEYKGILPSWMLTHIASDPLSFSNVMRLLRRYSMIEEANELGTYSLHPVVHKWAYHYFHNEICKTMGRTALTLIGSKLTDYLPLCDTKPLFRILPHVQSCFERISMKALDNIEDKVKLKEDQTAKLERLNDQIYNMQDELDLEDTFGVLAILVLAGEQILYGESKYNLPTTAKPAQTSSISARLISEKPADTYPFRLFSPPSNISPLLLHQYSIPLPSPLLPSRQIRSDKEISSRVSHGQYISPDVVDRKASRSCGSYERQIGMLCGMVRYVRWKMDECVDVRMDGGIKK